MQGKQFPPGYGRLETHLGKGSMLPEKLLFSRQKPIPTHPQRGKSQKQSQKEGLEELAAVAIKIEFLAPEIRMGHHEPMALRGEEWIIEAQGDYGQKRTGEEEPQEILCLSPERKPNSPPGSPAEPISPSSHHGQRYKQND